MSKARHELFDRFTELGMRVRRLGGIVQNEPPEIPDAELAEWKDLVNGCLKDLNCLKEDTIRFHNKID